MKAILLSMAKNGEMEEYKILDNGHISNLGHPFV